MFKKNLSLILRKDKIPPSLSCCENKCPLVIWPENYPLPPPPIDINLVHRVSTGTGKQGKWVKQIPCMENSGNLKICKKY